MKFLINTATWSYEDHEKRRGEAQTGFKRYKDYLNKNRDSFPESVFQFACAPWHYDTDDSRCPRDSWVEYIKVFELRSKTGRRLSSGINIEICLLGPNHDGHLYLTYTDVKSYSLNLESDDFDHKIHGDWLIDEIRLSETNCVMHEIDFHMGGTWLNECSDIQIKWVPLGDAHGQP